MFIIMMIIPLISLTVQCFHCVLILSKITFIKVTGFWKTEQIVTLGLFHSIGPATGYTRTLHNHSAITRLGRLVCFPRVSLANPLNSQLRQWDPCGCYMEGMGLKFTLVLGRHLLCHLSIFGPMAGTSGTH